MIGAKGFFEVASKEHAPEFTVDVAWVCLGASEKGGLEKGFHHEVSYSSFSFCDKLRHIMTLHDAFWPVFRVS